MDDQTAAELYPHPSDPFKISRGPQTVHTLRDINHSLPQLIFRYSTIWYYLAGRILMFLVDAEKPSQWTWPQTKPKGGAASSIPSPKIQGKLRWLENPPFSSMMFPLNPQKVRGFSHVCGHRGKFPVPTDVAWLPSQYSENYSTDRKWFGQA